jgi:hypothetical protein
MYFAVSWILGGEYLLLRGVVGERDALFNIALQALDCRLEQGLLLVGDITQDVDGLLSPIGLVRCVSINQFTFGTGRWEEMTYPKLNGDREEVNANILMDLLATRDTREVDIAGLDETLGALGSLEELLGKSELLLESCHRKT